MVDKPPRAKHCYDCGRCVRRMDHHCWWLGNCVGERTHRRFLYFLGAQALLLWWTCAAAVAGVVSAAHGEVAAPEGATAGEVAAAPIPPRVPQSLTLAAGVVVALFTLVIGLAALTLLVFQLALMLRGETTWEHLRREQLNSSLNLPPQLRRDIGRCREI